MGSFEYTANDVLVSVVVPVYKVEPYLNKCVESIVVQTHRNLEIILVDDGSPDSCPAICDNWASKDNRIQVIHKKNGGLSDTRNVGIARAQGAYVALIDSDDFISEFFVEILLKNALEYHADVVSLDREGVFLDGKEEEAVLAQSSIDYKSYVLTQRQALELHLYQVTQTGAQFHFYKKELFDDILYPVGQIFEDLATTYRIYLKSNIIVKVDANLYAYRKRLNSIMSQGFNENKMVMIPTTQKLYADLCEIDITYQEAAASRCFSGIFSVLRFVPSENKKERALLWFELKKYRKSVLLNNNKTLRLKNKLGAFISFGGMHCCILFGKLLNIQQRMH